MKPGDTAYIKVESGSGPSRLYDILADTNPNLSGVSIAKYTNGAEPTTYYGVERGNLTTVKYRISNCSTIIPNSGGKTYKDAYEKAIDVWNHVGSLYLNQVNSGEDVLLTVNSISNIQATSNDTTALAYSHVSIFYHWWFGDHYSFSADYVWLANDPLVYSNIVSGSLYSSIVGLAVHQIGLTLGLDNYNNTFTNNMMFHQTQPFVEMIGDGDIASYKYLFE